MASTKAAVMGAPPGAGVPPGTTKIDKGLSPPAPGAVSTTAGVSPGEQSQASGSSGVALPVAKVVKKVITPGDHTKGNLHTPRVGGSGSKSNSQVPLNHSYHHYEPSIQQSPQDSNASSTVQREPGNTPPHMASFGTRNYTGPMDKNVNRDKGSGKRDGKVGKDNIGKVGMKDKGPGKGQPFVVKPGQDGAAFSAPSAVSDKNTPPTGGKDGSATSVSMSAQPTPGSSPDAYNLMNPNSMTTPQGNMPNMGSHSQKGSYQGSPPQLSPPQQIINVGEQSTTNMKTPPNNQQQHAQQNANMTPNAHMTNTGTKIMSNGQREVHIHGAPVNERYDHIYEKGGKAMSSKMDDGQNQFQPRLTKAECEDKLRISGNGPFEGQMKSYNPTSGIGYVFSASVYDCFNRDALIHRVEVIPKKLNIGDKVQFYLKMNGVGQIQVVGAVNLSAKDPNHVSNKGKGQGKGQNGAAGGVGGNQTLAAGGMSSNGQIKSANYFEGRIKSYYEHKGYGFIECEL